MASTAQTTIVASQDHTIRRQTGTATVENNLHIKQSATNSTDRFVMLRFDSSDFGPDVANASFLFSANPDTEVQFQGTYDYEVFGVLDGDLQDESFIEGAANYAPNDPDALFDGSADMIDESQVTSLGTFTASAGTQVNLNSPELTSFLQADTNGVATLVVIRLTSGRNSTFLDRNAATPPRLQFDLSPSQPNGFVISDFDYDSTSGEAAITFFSTPGTFYVLEISTDGENWNEVADSSITGSPDATTTTLSGVTLSEAPFASSLLVRVKEINSAP